MTDVKVTKKEYFGMIRTYIEGSGVENENEILEFIDKEVKTLDKRAEKAKERAEKKREESDELKGAILEVLTNVAKTGAEIVEELDREGVTKQKVTTRLTRLINEGKAVKEVVKTEDKKRVTVYKAATAE